MTVVKLEGYKCKILDVVNDFNYLEVPFLLFKQINICIRKETETLVKVLLLQYLV